MKRLFPGAAFFALFCFLPARGEATGITGWNDEFPYKPGHPPAVCDTGSTREGILQVVSASNKFAFDLYPELAVSAEGNLFYSPHSIFSALAITYEGTREKTAAEIKSAMHFPELEILRKNYAAIYNNLSREDAPFEFRTGNALWLQENYPFLEEFVHAVERYYGGMAAGLDFAETEKARHTINRFIEEQTGGKIDELIPPRILNPLTTLVITNAVCFNGAWKWEFDEHRTREMDFFIEEGRTVHVPMMHLEADGEKFNYLDTGSWQILELPYEGGEISMIILLPVEISTLSEPGLSAETFSEYAAGMQKTALSEIYMPKFKIDAKYRLREAFESLGVKKAFIYGKADFTGMSRIRELFINEILHNAYIDVDEIGTEAAAATAVIIDRGIHEEPEGIVFRADRPFIFVIQETGTGEILFLGRMSDPTE